MGLKLNAAPHSARKTYAVEMFKDKGLEQTKKELQHDRISTTMLYAFSDMLCGTEHKTQDIVDMDAFAEIIAEKVAKKLEKMLEL